MLAKAALDKAVLLIMYVLREGRQNHSEHSDFGSWWFTYQAKEGWEKDEWVGLLGRLVHVWTGWAGQEQDRVHVLGIS